MHANTSGLDSLGWPRDRDVPEGHRVGRVVSVYSARVDLLVPASDAATWASLRASLRSRTLRDTEGGVAVGDWVLLHATDDVVESVLPRVTVFQRQAAGERSEPQVIAANVDRVFIVTSADGDFNVRRIERYLVAIAAGGAEAQIVLTKADVADDLEGRLAAARRLTESFATSARSGVGLDVLKERIAPRTTAALVGSSGVGKSALVNVLLGRETQLEGAVRAYDGRGRHTTTRRSLFPLAWGGFLIDTPGMRELTPWLPGDGEDLDESFDDVTRLADACRYRDCTHDREPGCALRDALERGLVAADRVAAWKHLRAQQRETAPRQAEHMSKRRQRSATLALRKRLKEKG